MSGKAVFHSIQISFCLKCWINTCCLLNSKCLSQVFWLISISWLPFINVSRLNPISRPSWNLPSFSRAHATTRWLHGGENIPFSQRNLNEIKKKFLRLRVIVIAKMTKTGIIKVYRYAFHFVYEMFKSYVFIFTHVDHRYSQLLLPKLNILKSHSRRNITS